MSNPIVDTAEYFAQKKAQLRHSAIHPRSSACGHPRAHLDPDFGSGADHHHAISSSASAAQDARSLPTVTPRRDDSLFDPRAQWNRVVSRLSFLAPEPPTREDSLYSDDFSDEEADTVDHDTFELMRSAARENRLRARFYNTHAAYDYDDDDERLPSAADMNQDPDSSNESADENYFAHPFPARRPSASPRTALETIRYADAPPSSSQPHEASSEPNIDKQARRQWTKTLDKIRLISNIQSFPQSPRDIPPANTNALAPYYPPAFEPIFIALSSDEYGRKLPPILLQCLSVSVTDSEFLTNGVNQWVFRIELQYGDVKWVIRRTIADFVALHYTLKFKSSLSDYAPAPPSFPNQLQSLISSAKTTIGLDREEEETYESDGEKKETVLKRRLALTNYLRELLQRAHMMISYDVCEFLELSAISMAQDMGWKGKEGFLQHRTNYLVPRFCGFWSSHRWNTEWIILRDSYIAFCQDIASTAPTDVMLFDKGFSITTTEPSLLGTYHLTCSNQFRRIEIKGGKREMDEWLEGLKKVQSESPWVKNHRFGSFAPIRHHSKVKWFVDAENHFNAVAEAILAAKSEIYIADWWLSPELYLRRPPEENEDFRLDRLLQRKAREGVMIYIVVYKEMALALTINSAHTKSWLQNLHPNIIVQRHPDHRSIDNTVLFWSHHEKIVVVDNRLAFIGGLDLCFGRYDTHAHSLTDYPAVGHEKEIFPGQDYSNPRAKDFVDVAKYDLTLVDRTVIPRMPWHDVTLAVVGPIARDISRHFIQRWNFLKSSKSMHRSSVPFLMPKGEYVAARDESKFMGTCRVQLLRSSAQWSSGIEREHSIYNAYMECITQAKHYVYIENQFFISATNQDKVLRNKIAQAMVERIKRAHEKGEKFRIFILIPLIPAFEGDLASSESSSARAVMHFQYISISRGGNSIMEKLREAGIEPSDYISWYSLRNWGKLVPPRRRDSATQTKDEDPQQQSPFDDEARAAEDLASLSDASVDANEVSEESRKSTDPTFNTNDERDNFVSEILYIHDKLMIVDDRIVLMGSANINDRSQLGNRDSEIAMLVEDTEMIPSLIDGKECKVAKFAYTLRMQLWKEHLGLLNFEDWSELLPARHSYASEESVINSYISQSMGDHLRPISVSNEEDIRRCENEEPVRMIDRASRTRSFYDTFRAVPHVSRRGDTAALDPLSDHFYNHVWRKTAEYNTLTYREIFRCVPDDTVHTYEQHRKFVPDPSKIPQGHVANTELSTLEIREKLESIRGHLVQFPHDYLKDENMVGGNLLETVTPMIIFT
ncbi:uncharacterized protein BYT42DRAFT_581253 [Radiomyces spectabilis]|uniref:uncharacterized protein n=1 Tax=Radiomyces spectabilis TaxID=64574 RepID=UPI00221E96D6|nr:uncharacterized protein BYT42DRAFT_581253 [Radiomyces spectabilis]KAI8371715.1 hypothetical protein BYT42DRAFT_581253 [Radiomyces spectabilis]